MQNSWHGLYVFENFNPLHT